jgi:hypothetical protein
LKSYVFVSVESRMSAAESSILWSMHTDTQEISGHMNLGYFQLFEILNIFRKCEYFY